MVYTDLNTKNLFVTCGSWFYFVGCNQELGTAATIHCHALEFPLISELTCVHSAICFCTSSLFSAKYIPDPAAINKQEERRTTDSEGRGGGDSTVISVASLEQWENLKRCEKLNLRRNSFAQNTYT